ncbi:MAG: hypothetical protein IIC83_05965 [Chloroflexi bacterium]|nr:hypothetical protein [Chloroflexota bacterium]
MIDTSDLIIFWAVVAVRFFVPFAIPWYPLPGVLVALVADGIDQTIFQQYTNIPLDNYQGYDKALDIYYLTITYMSTYRTWTNLFGFQLDRFFFHYRLVGVTLFEITQFRPLMMIFPNTFEYFFIFYEIVRLKWDPRRLGKRHIIAAGVLLWILIKLPQEFIIHIAQVDTTDWFSARILGTSDVGSTPGGLLSNPFGVAVLVLLVALVLIATWWLIRRLPATDWSLTFLADTHLESNGGPAADASTGIRTQKFLNMAFVEKIVMVSLVGIIFAQVLPDMRASSIEIIVAGIILILINTSLSQWLARQGSGWTATFREFIVLLAVNFVLILIIAILLPTFDGSINLVNVIFFTLLFTIVTTMLDRFRQQHLGRFATFVDSAAVSGVGLGQEATAGDSEGWTGDAPNQ